MPDKWTKWTNVSVRELNGCLLFLQYTNTPDSLAIRETKKQIQGFIDFMLQNGMQEMGVEENEVVQAIKLMHVEYTHFARIERR